MCKIDTFFYFVLFDACKCSYITAKTCLEFFVSLWRYVEPKVSVSLLYNAKHKVGSRIKNIQEKEDLPLTSKFS